MTEGEFPFRSFTMRSEGYDRSEVDNYVDELHREIVEQRRALETATQGGDGPLDSRLHDPEGAVIWAAEIESPGLREAAMIRAGTRYFQQNQSAATAWFASSGLPANALSRMSPQVSE